MGRHVWTAWFDDALAAGNGGDLALLADEAPDLEAEVTARVAAFRALRTAGTTALARLQVDRLARNAPETAAALAAQVDSNPNTTPGPTLALVLAGHMIDAPGRDAPRFPQDLAPGVAERVRETMARLAFRPRDRAVVSAAAGGDLLLADAAMEAGMNLTVCLPFDRARFLESSVNYAGDSWTRRFRQLIDSPGVIVREMPPAADPNINPFERVNHWMAYLALASEADNVRGMVIWDGREGDGPGGAGHMIGLLQELGVPVDVIRP